MGQCQSSPTAHDEGYRLTGRSNRIHPMMPPWGKSFGVMWGKCSNMGLAKMASSANIGFRLPTCRAMGTPMKSSGSRQERFSTSFP